MYHRTSIVSENTVRLAVHLLTKKLTHVRLCGTDRKKLTHLQFQKTPGINNSVKIVRKQQ